MLQPPPASDRRPGPPDVDADEHAFEAFARAQDPLDIEAATWVARKRNGLDAEGEGELQDWLAADPRHGEAYGDMDATLGHVGQLPQGEVSRLKTALCDGVAVGAPSGKAGPVPTPTRHPSGLERRPWWAGLGALLPRAAAAGVIAFALVGGGWLGWEHLQQSPTFERDYATMRGRQLSVRLPDAEADAEGSTMQLDTATQTQVRLYRDRREVQLKDGQAMFSVHADPERPFEVRAGGLRVIVVGTRFSVRHTHAGLDAGRTVVSVEEGRVRVVQAASAGDASTARPSVELAAGQMVVTTHGGAIGPVASVPASAIAPWRHGRVSFDQTPLAQAIAEFERYGRTGLVVANPAVAAMPVGGSYSLGQFQRFVETLPQVLPVRLVRRGDVTEVVAQ